MLQQPAQKTPPSRIRMLMLRSNVANRTDLPMREPDVKLPQEAAQILLKFFLNSKDSFRVIGPRPNVANEHRNNVRKKLQNFWQRIRNLLIVK